MPLRLAALRRARGSTSVREKELWLSQTQYWKQSERHYKAYREQKKKSVRDAQRYQQHVLREIQACIDAFGPNRHLNTNYWNKYNMYTGFKRAWKVVDTNRTSFVTETIWWRETKK